MDWNLILRKIGLYMEEGATLVKQAARQCNGTSTSTIGSGVDEVLQVVSEPILAIS
jgi:hypothetical protein